MTVSVIIVNYNVKYFLEQCLCSLQKAISEIDAEVIVLDNQSTDGSVDYLAPKFPGVKFIVNEENYGFAKACNIGLSHASGENILFLNPDTLLAEDCLQQCLKVFSKDAKAGAIGVRMIDGSGTFLKESKRAFPSPITALYKLFGLSKLFPKSKIFSRYYLGHLDEHSNHEVDVLAGAFLMIRREVLNAVGSFDETFFMYGEDIDLSYRIQKGGYKNYYVAEAEIIHFKGESTRRGTLNYVRMFYNAMSIFVKKHYGGASASFFIACLHFAIWVRACISAIGKLIRRTGVSFTDSIIILFSFWMITALWTTYVRTDVIYPNELLLVAFPVYTVFYLGVAYYAGLYNRSFRQRDLTRSMLIATVVLLAGYALLPESLRFSRGIVLFGSLLSFLLISLFRRILINGKVLQPYVEELSKPYLLVAATQAEFKKVKGFLQHKGFDKKIIGRMAVDDDLTHAVAPLQKLDEVYAALSAKEVIICIGAFSYKQTIAFIQGVKASLRLRFHAVHSTSIVSSESKTSGGETISTEADFNLAEQHHRRIKRLIDVVAAIGLLISFPFHLLGVNKPWQLLKNCFSVLTGNKTWIGYARREQKLPPLRRSVLCVNGAKEESLKSLSSENLQLVDYWYAKNYEPAQDIKLIVKNYRYLGS